MKFSDYTNLVFLFLYGGTLSLSAQTLTATEIIRKADEKFNGEKSSYMVMLMTIVRPTWERSVGNISKAT